MTAHEFDRVKHFGIGIPDDPTDEDVSRILQHLHLGTKVDWPKTAEDHAAVFNPFPRWNDGHQPRFYVVKNRTV